MGRQRKVLLGDGCSTVIDGKKIQFPRCEECPLPKCRFDVNGFESATMMRQYLEKTQKAKEFRS
jgi:hypothetical protein